MEFSIGSVVRSRDDLMRGGGDVLWMMMVLLGLALVGCEQETPPPVKVIRPVRFQAVSLTSGERVRTFAGTSKAGEETVLSFKVPGTMKHKRIKVGDKVKRGQTIAELDPRDYVLQVQSADAALARARAEARNAAATYSRTRGLYENNNASREELDAARAGHEAAKAQVRSAGKQREIARQQLSYTKLKAPGKAQWPRYPSR